MTGQEKDDILIHVTS